MKNKEKENFTKLTRTGISLIVLIITIIVIIILSAVIVMTISTNNPINSAKEAVFREDISNFKTELELYKASMKYKGENSEELNANRETNPHIQEVITSMSNKYAKILEVRKGKLVYIGDSKTEYRLAYEMGMLPEDELVDDEIIEELQPFITEWTVADGESITLPITGYQHSVYDFTVDYGDGTGEYNVTSGDDDDKTHTYEKSGTYTVIIKGACPNFMFHQMFYGNANHVTESKDKITKIVQWGNVFKNANNSTWALGVNFYNCKNLTGPIPEPSKNSFKNIREMGRLFNGCINLNCEIPDKLLYNCHNVTDMMNIFDGSGVVGEIPENLFKDCENVIDLREAFRNCKGITGNIPEELFANCSNLETISWEFWGGLFYNCTGITGEIPENLFANCPKITTFHSLFKGCSGLTGSIPENLFANNVDVTNFWWTFEGCTGLTGEIPENLFKNNTKVTTFAGTFANCKNLIGNIPENLFANCSEFTTVINYEYGTFENCIGLTGNIPENLFKNNTKISDFSNVFKGCSGLTGNIPEALFAGCENITSVNNSFYGCSNLTGNAPALWEIETITNYKYCFKDCKKLSNYNEIPKDWGGGGT